MTVTTTRKITFEEYLTYDDGTDKRYDFNDGELIEVTPATVLHNDVMMFLAFFYSHQYSNINYLIVYVLIALRSLMVNARADLMCW